MLDVGAAELARRIAAGETTSLEATQACIDRIEQTHRSLNAVVVPLFASALQEAAAADARQRAGEPLGPLHGVPFTVKECFHVAGTPSCLGLSKLKDEIEPTDGVLVDRLRKAGGVLLGKTNIPQLMLWHECDNPVYGRTNNPWDLTRTPGGSSGGEAAIIAAQGSHLGLANDLGGSIRVPAHFCGIAGFKPTSLRLTREGTRRNLRGMHSIIGQPGPMARRVEDLILAMEVLTAGANDPPQIDVAPGPFPQASEVRIDKLRIAYWVDDGFFPSSPAVQRAVREAAEALRQRGAVVEAWQPDFVADAVEAFSGLASADGGRDSREMTRGSEVDWRLSRLLTVPALWRPVRYAAVWGMQAFGQQWMARQLRLSRHRSARGFWQMTEKKNWVVRRFQQAMAANRYDAFLCPPHALPAMQHGKPIDLLAAASYCLLPNLLGVPCGTVPVTRVREDEQSSRPRSRDKVVQQAAAVDTSSKGLPIGVQVGAPAWKDDVVLAVMQAIEQGCRDRDDHPGKFAGPNMT